MPIKREPVNASPVCDGHKWVIDDQSELARFVAILMLGEHLHARRILDQLQPTVPPRRDDAIDRVIAKLTLQPGQDPSHRDGWIMQFLSWIVCYKHRSKNATVRAPQPRRADKGFDGLVVEVDAKGHLSILVCEDKATGSPRDTFRDKVLPEIESFEAGQRDEELLSDLTVVLETSDTPDVDRVVATIDWASARRYRVSLSAFAKHQTPAAMKRLFNGFEKSAPGTLDRRCGETACMDPLRGWMDGFCQIVTTQLEGMKPNVRP
jgi:hypothetical protein